VIVKTGIEWGGIEPIGIKGSVTLEISYKSSEINFKIRNFNVKFEIFNQIYLIRARPVVPKRALYMYLHEAIQVLHI